jgi:hypothetical protein
MSNLNRQWVIALALTAAGVGAQAADTREGQVDLRSVDRIAKTGAPKARKTEDRVRCWQYGRLIFESAVSPPAEKPSGVVEMRSGSGGSVQLMDMRHGLCIVESSRK